MIRSWYASWLLAAALTAALPAQAATYIVTRSDDPAPDACLPADCSLREAIAAANLAPAADRVELPAATHQLALGEIAIEGALELAGAGAAATTIRGSDLTTRLRALPGSTLRIADLTLDGPDPFAPDARGTLAVAVAIDSHLPVTLERTRVTIGGGLVQSGTGEVDVDDSSLFALFCQHDAGACRVVDSDVQLLMVAGGDLSFLRSNLTGLLVPGISSGASIETAGTVLFEDSAIADTFGGLSFQVGVPERVDLRRVRYLRNGAPLLVRQPIVVWIEDCEFSDNHNRFTGDSGGPGAIHAYFASIFHVARTSFIGNRGSGDAGGAILVEGNASLWLSDSTFSGNTFSVEAAAAGARGAAVAVRAGNSLSLAELRHSTVVAPAIMPAGMSGSAFAVIGADAQVHFAVHNSIVRGSCDLPVGAGHVDFAQGNVKSSGDNCGFDAGDNQLGASSAAVALGALGDHGAFAPTYSPAPGSIAIDTAFASRCTARDQRNYQRPYPEAACDVGAVEVGAEERIFADGFQG